MAYVNRKMLYIYIIASKSNTGICHLIYFLKSTDLSYRMIMASNKRKGRTRIKLDAKKIALAKQLILREATTTVIANELNISRTFAWRLRKSLVNGVSLHERVIDPPDEEEEDNETHNGALENGHSLNMEQKAENQLNHTPFTEHIKRECNATDEEEVDHEDSDDEQRQQHHLQQQQQQLHINQQLLRQNSNNSSVATSVIQRTKELKQTNINNNNNAQQQTPSLKTKAIIEQQQQHINTISVVQQQRLMELHTNASKASHPDNETASESDSELDDGDDDYSHHRHQHQETELVNSQQQKIYLQKPTNTNTNLIDTDNPLANGKLPLMTQLSPAVAAAM